MRRLQDAALSILALAALAGAFFFMQAVQAMTFNACLRIITASLRP